MSNLTATIVCAIGALFCFGAFLFQLQLKSYKLAAMDLAFVALNMTLAILNFYAAVKH